jgi:hypothetical protein
MTTNILSLARRHVLGDIYSRCESLDGSIPVYLAGDEPTLLGYADESLGHYADAFSFHLDPDSCKKLSAGQFGYTIDAAASDPKRAGSRSRLVLKSITLSAGVAYAKPVKQAG